MTPIFATHSSPFDPPKAPTILQTSPSTPPSTTLTAHPLPFQTPTTPTFSRLSRLSTLSTSNPTTQDAYTYPTCQEYAGGICSPIYSPNSALVEPVLVYVPANHTQNDLELVMRTKLGVFGAVDRVRCGPYMLAVLCQQVIPTCMMVEDGSGSGGGSGGGGGGDGEKMEIYEHNWGGGENDGNYRKNGKQRTPNEGEGQQYAAVKRWACDAFCPKSGKSQEYVQNEKIKSGEKNTEILNIFENDQNFEYFDQKSAKNPTPDLFTPSQSLKLPELPIENTYFPPQECSGLVSRLFTSPYPSLRFRPWCYPKDPKYGEFTDYPGDELYQNYQNNCDDIYHNFVDNFTKEFFAAEKKTENISEQKKIQQILLSQLPEPQCPHVLVKIDDEVYNPETTPCSIPCPNMSISKEHFKLQSSLFIIFSFFSFSALTFYLISWFLFPRTRFQPYLVFYMASLFMVQLSFVGLSVIALGSKRTIAQSLCRTNSVPYHMSGYPLIQGITLTFFFVSAMAWGFVLILDVFLVLCVGMNCPIDSKKYNIKNICYHCFVWGCSSISLIGALAHKQIGSSLTGAFAVIGPSQQQFFSGTKSVANYFFYWPIFGFSFLSAILTLIIICNLLIIKFNPKPEQIKRTKFASRISFFTFLRLFLFFLVNIFITTTLVIFSLRITSKAPEWLEARLKYTNCLHVQNIFFQSVDLEQICGKGPNINVPLLVLYFYALLYPNCGYFFVFIFMTRKLLKSWWKLITCQGRESDKKVVKNGKNWLDKGHDQDRDAGNKGGEGDCENDQNCGNDGGNNDKNDKNDENDHNHVNNRHHNAVYELDPVNIDDLGRKVPFFKGFFCFGKTNGINAQNDGTIDHDGNQTMHDNFNKPHRSSSNQFPEKANQEIEFFDEKNPNNLQIDEKNEKNLKKNNFRKKMSSNFSAQELTEQQQRSLIELHCVQNGLPTPFSPPPPTSHQLPNLSSPQLSEKKSGKSTKRMGKRGTKNSTKPSQVDNDSDSTGSPMVSGFDSY